MTTYERPQSWYETPDEESPYFWEELERKNKAKEDYFESLIDDEICGK